jgi:hypothetical protein
MPHHHPQKRSSTAVDAEHLLPASEIASELFVIPTKRPQSFIAWTFGSGSVVRSSLFVATQKDNLFDDSS